MEVSIGDFVLSGGEVAGHGRDRRRRPAAARGAGQGEPRGGVVRAGLLEYPQYTRPREFRGMAVPDVLLSGDHAKIAAWRAEQARLRTMQRRPDLWEKYKRKNKTEP